MIFQITESDIDRTIMRMESKWFFDKIAKLKVKYRIVFFVWTVIFIIFWLLLFKKYPNIALYLFVWLMLFIVIIFKNFSETVKQHISSDYMRYFNNNIKYSVWWEFFPLSIRDFYNQSWILNNYETVDLQEDSIQIDTDSFKLYWQEIQTSEYVRDSKWRKRKRITNHSYIMLIEILKHRFPIKEDIKLFPDVQDSFIKKIFFSWLLWITFLLITKLIFSFFNISNNLKFLYSAIGFCLWVIIFFWISNQKRVKLENSDFEKIFDVYSENEIETRRLLTPKMMEKLVICTKYSKFRGFAMCFRENKIYMKFDVTNFMEINLFWKDIKEQIKAFLNQIRLVVDFVNWLNLEYFSEVEFLKK